MKREKARLDEEHAREVRDTEHKVGLLKDRQEQDMANTKRETGAERPRTQILKAR